MPHTRKGLTFWLIFLSICISLFVSALELTTVSTALPTIASSLRLSDSAFVWVGTGYSLASTAFLPLSGGLAEIFGRQHALLLSIGLFAAGSALCGAGTAGYVLIAGRAVQGLGGGRDKERGVYGVLTGLTWSIACVVGPVIGGGLAAQGAWRWLFYLNLPIAGLAAVFVVLFLRLPTPPGTFGQKIRRLDLGGNLLIIASTTCCTLALTWGGANASWTSLKCSFRCGAACSGWRSSCCMRRRWQWTLCLTQVPFILMCNRTSLSGWPHHPLRRLYVFFFLVIRHSLNADFTNADFLPVYFQACHSASALRSAVLGLGVAALAPAAIVAGVLVSKTGRYRPQMWTGWGISMIGLGLLSTVRRATPVWQTVLWGGVLGVGLGFEYSTTMFPVQAPLPVSQNARALAFLTFVGSFAGVWGLTIGGTVLDNQLLRRLPDSFTAHFAPPEGSSTLAYALIPRIPALPLLLRLEVQDAFAEALSVVWLVLAAIAGLGLLASLFMKGLPLHTKLDERWGLVEMDVRDSRDGRRAGRSRAPVLRFVSEPNIHFLSTHTKRCIELIEYATTDSHHLQLLPGLGRYETLRYAIPSQSTTTVIRDFTPRITTLYFVLIDCTATYGAWDTFAVMPYLMTRKYPLSLIELHVTFAYTAPPPALLLEAPRGTFFPPSFGGDLPARCRFDGVRRLVLRDANADFVAFLTTACPRLERVESTAEFRTEDVPQNMSSAVKARLMFVRLSRTVTWPGLTSGDTKPIPDPLPQTFGEWRHVPIPSSLPAKPCIPEVLVRKRRNSICRLWSLWKRIFRERK
ncbi:MFS general substrate transporter [Mycena venus]|uniref:MFS general substrate transporter n=1 Tax=Mycena venus TaxID=2733690 RepID=A0A8H6X396_9AGAR|nr:MFS general substrate transporter [Mycena venus]